MLLKRTLLVVEVTDGVGGFELLTVEFNDGLGVFELLFDSVGVELDLLEFELVVF